MLDSKAEQKLSLKQEIKDKAIDWWIQRKKSRLISPLNIEIQTDETEAKCDKTENNVSKNRSIQYSPKRPPKAPKPQTLSLDDILLEVNSNPQH